jgi:CubicO group peptidase (beta-lactamase class C family)
MSKQEQNQLKGFGDFVKTRMKQWNVPGTAIGIVKDGEVILAEGFGYRNLKEGLEMNGETVLAIGSASKAFTAFGLGLLVDDNKLDWDKPLREYIPKFKLKDEFASERVTTRDIMCHRTGLPRYEFMWMGSPFNREEIVERIRYFQPNKDFRSFWQYQNHMYITGGYLIEKITGNTWEDFTKKRIFDPIEMTNSNLSVNESKKLSNHALPYLQKDDHLIEIEFYNVDTAGPAGSINSNIVDMTKWIKVQLDKGKYGDQQLLSETNMKQLHSPQMVIEQFLPFYFSEIPHMSYGMGWFIEPYRGYNQVQHGGSINGFSTMVAFMPDENIGVVVLTNLNGANLFNYTVLYNIYDRLLGLDEIDWNTRMLGEFGKLKDNIKKQEELAKANRVEGTNPSHALEDYTGTYESKGFGVVIIKKVDDELRIIYNSYDTQLKHIHYDVFEMIIPIVDATLPVTFFIGKNGDINSLYMPFEFLPGIDDIKFVRCVNEASK